MPRQLAALACLLVVAGCGGGSGSGSAFGTPSGAEIAPKSALAFVSINTDQTSEQWKQADKLLSKFSIRDKLLTQVNEGLSQEGIDFQREVLPLFGPEVDIVIIGVENDEPQYVGLTKPTDERKFAALDKKGSSPSVHEKIGDWTAFADKQSSIDAFKSAANGGKLADDQQFKDAMGELPGEANAKAYVNGDKLIALLKQSVPNLGPIPGGEKLQWLSLALESTDDGWKLEGAAKSSAENAAQMYEPKLMSKVPSGSLVVASFHGNDQTFRSLRDNPDVAKELGRLQSMIGVSLDDLEQLFAGEGAFYVRQGSPFPEATLLVHPKSPQQARATLDRLAAKAREFEPSLRTTRTSINGTAVRKLSLGPVALYWGIKGGELVVTDSTGPFNGTSAGSLDDDAVFSKAKDAAGMPDKTAGFLYVNIKDSIPLIESFAQTAQTTIPPEVAEALGPLQSFVAWATAEDGVTKFAALLQVR